MRNSRWTMTVGALCLALVLFLSPGCKKDDTEINLGGGDGTGTTGTGTGTGTGTSTGLNEKLELEKLIFEKLRALEAVYFDFDSYVLRPDGLASLKRNAEKLKQAPLAEVIVQIEGHCDERGTQEYNFALGERRALAVRAHLMKLGISGDRLVTISYGEEKPAVDGHDESAWSKNRRCEFNKAK
ncbi:MAG: peptidoglycan-associated lipoprotein Pal [bacterium]|nr:peptidoglycan-associated lipoprotein Pal [bacterium]